MATKKPLTPGRNCLGRRRRCRFYGKNFCAVCKRPRSEKQELPRNKAKSPSKQSAPSDKRVRATMGTRAARLELLKQYGNGNPSDGLNRLLDEYEGVMRARIRQAVEEEEIVL